MVSTHQRKAISPLVATILLIAFTLVIAGIIAGWATQFARTQREAITFCQDARILIRSGVYDPATETLTIAVNNYGLVDLNFNTILKYQNGSEVATPVTINTTAGSLVNAAIPNVPTNLQEITIQSTRCPGATDLLGRLQIKGLGI